MSVVTQEEINALRLELLQEGRDVHRELARREKEIAHFVNLHPQFKVWFEQVRS